MTRQDETHRVMFTLTDQAIAKLNQLVAKKQQEVNQNSDLAKYHVKVTKSNILEAMLSKNRTIKRKD
ncbi:plasmid replication protein [Lacticaseibacillus paracasei]|uniref:plasmid replication protein n=1 Tax=Lacticaseibacillus paracasei TaxID=1597 RepID=UPI0030CBA632